MNKKTSIFVLLLVASALPFVVLAANNCGGGTDNTPLTGIVNNVKDAALSVGAGLAVLGFIIAGIIYLTSGGSPEKTGIAKKALIAAVIGTALVALAGGVDIITEIFCVMIQ